MKNQYLFTFSFFNYSVTIITYAPFSFICKLINPRVCLNESKYKG